MAAGLGFKEFTTGDVLTAADANGYLASQVVMVFASAAARTSAIASPQEGMVSYLKDTNSTEYYSGSAWVAIGGSSSGPTFRATRAANQTGISSNTWTKAQINTETWDTASAYDNATNYRFTPLTAGYYYVRGSLNTGTSTDTIAIVAIYKNGSSYAQVLSAPAASGYQVINVSDLVYFNGTTDYVELFVNLASGSTINGGATENIFSAVWIRG
jgi:hypothetical protein